MTALQAVEELDAGPIWGTADFPAPRRTAPQEQRLQRRGHRGRDRAGPRGRRQGRRPGFVPGPRRPRLGRLRPALRQADRAFRWSDPHRGDPAPIRAADGSPGVRTTLCGVELSVYDAHPGPPPHPAARAPCWRSGGALLVATGDGTLWIGQPAGPDGARAALKLPATRALDDRLRKYRRPVAATGDHLPPRPARSGAAFRVLQRRHVHRAVPSARRRAAPRHRDDTRVLVLAGGEVFSNGIHLGVTEAAPSPPTEAWRNITAIDDVCRKIITCTDRWWWRRSAATRVPAG